VSVAVADDGIGVIPVWNYRSGASAYPFAKIAEALAYVESGRAKGKVVITPMS
jgi:hypothetical protein